MKALDEENEHLMLVTKWYRELTLQTGTLM